METQREKFVQLIIPFRRPRTGTLLTNKDTVSMKELAVSIRMTDTGK